MTHYFSDILENISLSSSDIQFNDMLTEDDESWTIHVICPEGTSEVSPLCENETLIALEAPELSSVSESNITQENSEQALKKIKVKPRRYATANDRYYKCLNCDKEYNARRNLTRHINSECGKEPKFTCPYCDYKNYRRNEFKKHLKSKHNISLDISDDMNVL